MQPPERPASFLDEQASAERVEARRQVLRWALGFGLLFAGVFLAFWWSGAALRFSASRIANTATPSYKVWGIVSDARTGRPIPWARVADDPRGRPPFFQTDADQRGSFTLLTLAEPHWVRVTANGYRPAGVQVGRHWFVWWPRGQERRDVELHSE